MCVFPTSVCTSVCMWVVVCILLMVVVLMVLSYRLCVSALYVYIYVHGWCLCRVPVCLTYRVTVPSLSLTSFRCATSRGQKGGLVVGTLCEFNNITHGYT